MGPKDLTEDVRRLLRDYISSLEQVEILLLLHAQPDQEWTAKTVFEELRGSEDSTAARLADLEKHGFLVSRKNQQGTVYRYAPTDSWLSEAVTQLQAAYAERRYTVIELIFAKPIDNLRVYAGAFRFRKDKSDG